MFKLVLMLSLLISAFSVKRDIDSLVTPPRERNITINDLDTIRHNVTAPLNTTLSDVKSIIKIHKSEKFGDYLVDNKNRSFYTFEREDGSTGWPEGCNIPFSVNCSKEWYPLIWTKGFGKSRYVGKGLQRELLGKTKIGRNRYQITYNKHPLFRYAKDEMPLDTKGHNLKSLGANWYLLDPKGNKVKVRS